jgi:hypothetical protein
MTPTQGWFESDGEYRARVAKEADERTIEKSTGASPSQRLFESDDGYRDRITREATEHRIEEASGSARSQGIFESDGRYRSRIEKEANEQAVERASGSAPSQRFFESNEDYEVRIRREANEHALRDSGASPTQGSFEGDHAYRSRIAHDAREIRADGRTTFNDPSAKAGSSYSGSAAGASTSHVDARSSSSMVWFAIVGAVALFVAWQWLQASQRAADKRSQVAAAVAAAEEAVNRRDFDQAENWFRHARTVAADLDAAVTKELSVGSRRSISTFC